MFIIQLQKNKFDSITGRERILSNLIFVKNIKRNAHSMRAIFGMKAARPLANTAVFQTVPAPRPRGFNISPVVQPSGLTATKVEQEILLLASFSATQHCSAETREAINVYLAVNDFGEPNANNLSQRALYGTGRSCTDKDYTSKLSNQTLREKALERVSDSLIGTPDDTPISREYLSGVSKVVSTMKGPWSFFYRELFQGVSFSQTLAPTKATLSADTREAAATMKQGSYIPGQTVQKHMDVVIYSEGKIVGLKDYKGFFSYPHHTLGKEPCKVMMFPDVKPVSEIIELYTTHYQTLLEELSLSTHPLDIIATSVIAKTAIRFETIDKNSPNAAAEITEILHTTDLELRNNNVQKDSFYSTYIQTPINTTSSARKLAKDTEIDWEIALDAAIGKTRPGGNKVLSTILTDKIKPHSSLSPISYPALSDIATEIFKQ